ncbi:MAG: hypothetical protein Q9180_007692, partial [Flavoplaca navasiana]
MPKKPKEPTYRFMDHEFDLDDLRAFLGLVPPPAMIPMPVLDTGTVVPVSNTRKLVVGGQDFMDDTRKLFRFLRHFPCHVLGYVDSLHIMQKASSKMQDVVGLNMGRIVTYYEIEPIHRRVGPKNKPEFKNEHNAAHDSHANMKAFLAQAADACLYDADDEKTYDSDDSDDPDNRSYDFNPNIPPQFPQCNDVIFLCWDVEFTDHVFQKFPIQTVSEIGLSTFDTRNTRDVAPGKNGKNWWQFVQTRHIVIEELKEFKQRSSQGRWHTWKGKQDIVPAAEVRPLLESFLAELTTDPTVVEATGTVVPVANETVDTVDRQPEIEESVASIAHGQADEQPVDEYPMHLNIPSPAQEPEPESTDVDVPVAEVQNTTDIEEKQSYEPSNVAQATETVVSVAEAEPVDLENITAAEIQFFFNQNGPP